MILGLLDALARKLTWDGKSSGHCRRLQWPLLGVILLEHARYPGGTRRVWGKRAHVCRAPLGRCSHPETLLTVPNECGGCWRPSHVRIWLGLAERWLKWRYGSCTRCGARFTWRELGPRGGLQTAQSGSRWHADCSPRAGAWKASPTPWLGGIVSPADFEGQPRRVVLPPRAKGKTEPPQERRSP